jgi:ubiquinone/menaquinone biosynthesis C-methylase UbiE
MPICVAHGELFSYGLRGAFAMAPCPERRAPMQTQYVHGYTGEEDQRLLDQSEILEDLLHNDTIFEPGSRVLEVGCGVGAQTRFIARRNPQVHFICIDISEHSLSQARDSAECAHLTNVEFVCADAYSYAPRGVRFDHAFFCFVLEHVAEPERLVRRIARLLRKGGSIVAVEGDHGSTFFHPRSASAWQTIQCLIDLQAKYGGDALIGRRLYPLFCDSGLAHVTVSPRTVYADPSRPQWVQGFTDRTYIAMVQGVRQRALAEGLITAEQWDTGIEELSRTKEGTFSYTFFKAIGIVVG